MYSMVQCVYWCYVYFFVNLLRPTLVAEFGYFLVYPLCYVVIATVFFKRAV